MPSRQPNTKRNAAWRRRVRMRVALWRRNSWGRKPCPVGRFGRGHRPHERRRARQEQQAGEDGTGEDSWRPPRAEMKERAARNFALITSWGQSRKFALRKGGRMG